MKSPISAIAVFLMVSFAVAIHAEQTAYVTDSLRLRLYVEANDTSKVIESLESGDALEVLESQGAFSRVRIYDGTIGWVKSAFLVEQAPAKLLYYSVSEQNKQLEQQIKALQNKTAATNDAGSSQVTELQQALKAQQQTNQQLQKQLSLLEQQQSLHETSLEVSDTATRAQSTKYITHDKLLLFGIAAALLLIGIFFGLKISASRMRKRLHGYRLD